MRISDWSSEVCSSDLGGSSRLNIGQREGSDGMLTVTGSGSVVSIHGTDNGSQVGNSGTGTLNVADGGRIEALDVSGGDLGTGNVYIDGGVGVLSSQNGLYSGKDAP